MDEIWKVIVTSAPNLIGLVVLAYVLYRQNDRLLTALLVRVETLEAKLETLQANLSGQSLDGRVTPNKQGQ